MIASKNRELPSLANKRIIFVLGNFLMGGAERQAILLGRELVRQESADVHMWAFGGGGPATGLCEFYGLPWRTMNLNWPVTRPGKIGLFIRFAWTLRMARPDILMPYLTIPNMTCGITWPWTGATVCIWSQEDEGPGRIPGRLERLAVRQTTAFISNSEIGADHLINDIGVDTEKVHVVRNGIESPQPQSDRAHWREKLNVNEECFLACMVANLTDSKDQTTLIRAWQKVKAQMRSTGREGVLLLAGSLGSTYRSLQDLVTDLGLGTSVRFLNYVDDVWGLLRAVDLCVHSSVLEGCPNGVLEAMASGLPVVGTDIPGIRESVGPQGYEFLVPPGDSDAMAATIVRLMIDKDLRFDMGNINRRRIEREFGLERLGTETAAVLRKYLRQ